MFPYLSLFWKVESHASSQILLPTPMYSRVTVMQNGKKPLKFSSYTERETEAQRVARVQMLSQWPSPAQGLFLIRESTPTMVGTSCQYFSTNGSTMWLIFDIMQMKETRLSALLSREQEMKAVWGRMFPETYSVTNGVWKNQAFVHSSLSSSPQPWLAGLAPNPFFQNQPEDT